MVKFARKIDYICSFYFKKTKNTINLRNGIKK